MALDLYNAEDVRLNSRVCSLDDAELQILGPCITKLHSMTGIVLDAYGTTKLYQNQIDMIKQCLLNRQFLDKRKSKVNAPAMEIYKKLNCFKNGLVAFGD